MPIKLNLLPPELAISKGLANLLKTLRALGTIAIGAFLVFAVGVGAFFVISSTTLRSINANLDKLKSDVKAQEASEQQIILLKDRLGKIASIQKQASSLPGLNAVKPFLANLPAGAIISQMQIDSRGIAMSVNLKSYSDLSTFMDSIRGSDVFKTVNLAAFNLNPSTGYSIEVTMVKK